MNGKGGQSRDVQKLNNNEGQTTPQSSSLFACSFVRSSLTNDLYLLSYPVTLGPVYLRLSNLGTLISLLAMMEKSHLRMALLNPVDNSKREAVDNYEH